MYLNSNIKYLILAFLAVCILLNRPENAIAQNPSHGIAYDLEYSVICLVDSIATDTINQFWRFTHANSPGTFTRDVNFDFSAPYTVAGTVLSCKEYYAPTDTSGYNTSFINYTDTLGLQDGNSIILAPHEWWKDYWIDPDSLTVSGAGETDIPGQRNMKLGYNILNPLADDQVNVLIIGFDTGDSIKMAADDIILFGNNSFKGDPLDLTYRSSIGIGHNLLKNYSGRFYFGNLFGNNILENSSGQVTNSSFFGNHSAKNITNGIRANIFGQESGHFNSINNANIFGRGSGNVNLNKSGSILFGNNIASNVTGNISESIFIGTDILSLAGCYSFDSNIIGTDGSRGGYSLSSNLFGRKINEYGKAVNTVGIGLYNLNRANTSETVSIGNYNG